MRRGDVGRLELAAQRRDPLIGAGDARLEPRELQRSELAARHRLGDGVEHGYAGRAGIFAAFALRRSTVFALSTTKRAWVPLLTVSSSSLAVTANITLRPSTAVTSAVISTVMPGSVGARCLTDTSMPTESSLASAWARIRLRQVISMSPIRYGVA